MKSRGNTMLIHPWVKERMASPVGEVNGVTNDRERIDLPPTGDRGNGVAKSPTGEMDGVPRQDRESRDLLAAECRRTEVLIGKLLGPGETTQGRKDLSPTGEKLNGVTKDDRHKFRLLGSRDQGAGVSAAGGIRNSIKPNWQNCLPQETDSPVSASGATRDCPRASPAPCPYLPASLGAIAFSENTH
jgi:hypothetical protein